MVAGWLLRRRLGRLSLLIGLLAIGAVLAAALTGKVLLHDSTKPASVTAAVAQFRAHAGVGRGIGGVYVYATSGGESVDAVVSAHHVYPTQTGLTVLAAGCGIRMRWKPLQGRSTAWTLCRGPSGLELRISSEAHRFFGQSDLTQYICADEVLVPVDRRSGDRPFRCRSSRGRETGRLHIFGRESIRVGGDTVFAMHVRTFGHVEGGDSGTETVDWWLEPERGLPLRIVFSSRTSRPLPIGRARYREDAALRLVSTIPRR